MQKIELETPATLVDLDILDYNIKRFQLLCDTYKKQLWPMIKTHKSTEILKMQEAAGATGFLCGTLDECESICELGIKNIMYAYPVVDQVNMQRVIDLAKKCQFIVRIDSYDGAKMLNDAAKSAGVKVNYTIIIDCGLHRFGILPDKVNVFADSLKEFDNLILKGISTHPGQVYSAVRQEDIRQYVDQEKKAIKIAVDILKDAGYSLEMITTGSTPTFFASVSDEYINVFHPGNYVFNDHIQMSTNTAQEPECALSVYATIISHPGEDIFICDAGAKCLGLDQGAHGNSALKGYGFIKGHPELTVYSLSEEVAKIRVQGSTTLQIGDKIEIIPNHACSAANLTSFLIGCRGNTVVRSLKIDMRGNSTIKSRHLA